MAWCSRRGGRRSGRSGRLSGPGGCIAAGHTVELEGPQRAVPADAFETANSDEVAGVAQDAAQLGGEGRRHSERETPGLILQDYEADAVGRGWTLRRDRP